VLVLPTPLTFPFAVITTVEVPREKCPFASAHPPPTFHVFEDPAIVTEEFVMVTAPDVNVALSCVAVPAPELASKVTVSVAPGMQVQLAPPDAVAQ